MTESFCEESIFGTLMVARLSRPTGGSVEVIAGVDGDRLVLEGDIGLAPVSAMNFAVALEGIKSDREATLRSMAPELGDSVQAFEPDALKYRQAWNYVVGRSKDTPSDTTVKSKIEELEAWLQNDTDLGAREFGAVLADRNRLWPNRRVFYTLDSSLGGASTVVNKAIEHWRLMTDLQFEEANGATRDYINFIAGSTCESSGIGCSSGVQTISVTPICSKGNIIHELGHAVGLYHEHIRNDQANNIVVNMSNIQSAARPNFLPYGTEGENSGQYDFGSIMHYGRFAFAIDRHVPTITPVYQPSVEVGQRIGLSDGDRATVGRLYP